MRLPGPACATCREKCRRCDRARPVCQRCVSKGLQCGGYPDKYRFCGPTRKKSTISRRTRSKKDDVTGTGDTPDERTDASPASEVDRVLMLDETEMLLTHYDTVICPHQIAISNPSTENPYRMYILPLAYEQISLLYAVLGLAACHLGQFNSDTHLHETVAVGYRVKAIRALGEALEKGSSGVLHEDERDAIFATIQILLLMDICETGISTHGVHITGAVSICNQFSLDKTLTRENERTVFFLGNLAWLDIIRGFAGPERLCFSPELRQTIVGLTDMKFEMVNGCPKELFLIIGNVLDYAKAHSVGDIESTVYEQTLYRAKQDLLAWDQNQNMYPDDDPRWLFVADAFRNACILRTLRLLDVTQPADAVDIQSSVTAILDAISHVPRECCLIELLVLPLFMAGADCLSPHSRHYILLRLDEIKSRSEFCNPVPKDLLQAVWDERGRAKDGNVAWMQFTHNPTLQRQHDYLII